MRPFLWSDRRGVRQVCRSRTWRGEDELILLDVEEKRQYMEQAGATLLRIEGVRPYIEGLPQVDGRMARAVRSLLEVVDPDPDRTQHPEADGGGGPES